MGRHSRAQRRPGHAGRHSAGQDMRGGTALARTRRAAQHRPGHAGRHSTGQNIVKQWLDGGALIPWMGKLLQYLINQPTPTQSSTNFTRPEPTQLTNYQHQPLNHPHQYSVQQSLPAPT